MFKISQQVERLLLEYLICLLLNDIQRIFIINDINEILRMLLRLLFINPYTGGGGGGIFTPPFKLCAVSNMR